MRYLLTLFLVALTLTANARQISSDEAAAIASEVLNVPVASAGKSQLKVKRVRTASDKEEASPYYIFTGENSRGFAIISGDDRVQRILGYSDNATFDPNNVPPQLADLLGQYAEQIKSMKSGDSHPSWRASAREINAGDSILLKTANWGQEAPYNALTPMFDGVHAPAGCVATAMAIVMKYNNWPPQGRNSWNYINGAWHKDQSVDFSQSYYDFANYANDYSSESETNTGLAKLFYDAGIAACTYYRKDGSGADLANVGYELMRFFKYSPDCESLIKEDFSDEEWRNYIDENINNQMPVIYAANSSNKGHCFVIDGKKENLYHINWGWDGRCNGYFTLSNLNPYDNGSAEDTYSAFHQMVVNIKPDYEEQEFSEVNCSSGTERHYDAPWLSDWEKRNYVGKGMLIDTQDIQPNEPFSLITKFLACPNSFGGEIAVAVMDKNNQVVSILKRVENYDNTESPAFGDISYIYVHEASVWKNLVFDGIIEDGMRLQLVAKRFDEADWKIVNGTPHTPASLPMKGNTAGVVKDIVTYHRVDPDHTEDVIYSNEPSAIGSAVSSSLKCRYGIAHMFVNDEYDRTAGTVSGWSNKSREPYLNSSRRVDIYYTPQSDLSAKVLNDVTPGTLSSLFKEEDLLNLYRLKITGEVNINDIESLSQLRALGELDLSEANITGGIWFKIPFYLRVIAFPKNLKTITPSISGTQSATIVNIPESVKDCGNLSGASFIVLNSPIPPKANRMSQQTKVPGVLLVPKGCKEVYAQDEHWGNFIEIMELDPDDYFEGGFYIDNYIPSFQITHKFSAISDGYRFTDGGNIYFPSKYEYGRGEFPCRFIDLPFEKNGAPHSFISKMMWALYDFPPFNGRDIYILPETGHIKGYADSNSEYRYNMDYIVSPLLEPNFENMRGQAFVPAHSSIGTVTDRTDDLNNEFWDRFEMFSLDCDKDHNIFSAASNIEGITIEKVTVNGDVVLPQGSIYTADFSRNVEIAVTYDFNGFKTLTTTYPSEFIDKLPSVSIEGGVDSYELDAIKVEAFEGQIVISNAYGKNIDVHNLVGVCLARFEAKSTRTSIGVDNGIYIVSVGNKSFKIIVK